MTCRLLQKSTLASPADTNDIAEPHVGRFRPCHYLPDPTEEGSFADF